jgi:hypothetical protein
VFATRIPEVVLDPTPVQVVVRILLVTGAILFGIMAISPLLMNDPEMRTKAGIDLP